MAQLSKTKITVTPAGYPVGIIALACANSDTPVSDVSCATIERAEINGVEIKMTSSPHNPRIVCGDIPGTLSELVFDVARGHVYCEAPVTVALDVILHSFDQPATTDALLEDADISIGQLWTHHSGKQYSVINFSNKEPKPGWETNVVYAAVDAPDDWYTRPLREFLTKFKRLDG
jgi:hypothetical protein